jgi:hypothetical protein
MRGYQLPVSATSGLYDKSFTIINYASVWSVNYDPTIVNDDPSIINYDPKIVI